MFLDKKYLYGAIKAMVTIILFLLDLQKYLSGLILCIPFIFSKGKYSVIFILIFYNRCICMLIENNAGTIFSMETAMWICIDI